MSTTASSSSVRELLT